MKKEIILVVALFFSLAFCQITQAQTTEFNYQGSLNTGGSPANGNHDFEFALFNGGGVQIGSTIARALNRQQMVIEALRALVCRSNVRAEVCKQEKK